MTIDEHIEFLEREVKEYTSLLEENNGTYIDYQVWTQSKYECEQLVKWLTHYKRLLSAIEDIKSEIHKSSCFYNGTYIADGLDMAMHIIDKHISGKEDIDGTD